MTFWGEFKSLFFLHCIFDSYWKNKSNPISRYYYANTETWKRSFVALKLPTNHFVELRLVNNRMKRFLKTLSHSDQSGFVKDRYISDNIRSLFDIIDYTKFKQLPGAVLFVEFFKASDYLKWDFLFKILKKYAFSLATIAIVKLLLVAVLFVDFFKAFDYLKWDFLFKVLNKYGFSLATISIGKLLSGAVLFVDFFKAFDYVKWDFLFKVLNKYEFRLAIISIVKLLSEAVLLVNFFKAFDYLKWDFLFKIIKKYAFSLATITIVKLLLVAVLFVDFFKAFDYLKWDFLFKVLNKYGFSLATISIAKLLYKNSNCRIINNNFLSSPFDVRRGVRQGDPLSPTLFILSIECLAISLRNDRIF